VLRRSFGLSLFACVFYLFAGNASAHVDGEHSSLAYGWLHPLTGADHMVAMLGVGAWSAQIGGKAIWIIPTTFVSFMFFGGLIGFELIDVPYTEVGVALSITLLGLAISLHKILPISLATPAIAIFGICHGYLHGYEMPVEENKLSFTIGFLSTTAALHVVGVIGAHLALRSALGEGILRSAGVMSAAFGLVLLFQMWLGKT
jgi:urease accessory protein